MFSTLMLMLAVISPLFVLSTLPKLPSKGGARLGAVAGAALLFVAFFTLSSMRHIDANEVGIVEKNAFGANLTGGKIIATEGEMGVQAQILSPGWKFGYWPLLYNVQEVSLTRIDQGNVGIIEASDGLPLEAGQVFAPEFPADDFKQMLDAEFFLTSGNGYKGVQSSVLTPGSYRLNTELFKVTQVPQTTVKVGTVGVLKANFGAEPTGPEVEVAEGQTTRLALPGEKGIRVDVLEPGTWPINPMAYEMIEVPTRNSILQYTAASTAGGEQREIDVKTSDGFNFPVDVRVEFIISKAKAPTVAATLQGVGENFLNKLNATVRAIFRNNAEGVRALDYIQQRSQQERQSQALLAEAMSKNGVTITAVYIGAVGDEETLGELLTTQRDREIAIQQQITFQEQQRAAEQQKALTRTQQEAVEEKRLATAQYEVQIAEQSKQQRIIAAQAQAESIQIEAEAQAEAFRQIAQQIGSGNAALIELLKIVGERGIQITPRVMVSGSQGGTADAETTALIGTMLDTMMSRDDRGGRAEADGSGGGR